MAEGSTTTGFRSRSQQNEGKWLNLPTEVTEICSGGETNPVIYGKFYIPGQLEAGVSVRGFQAAAAAAGQEKVRGQRLSGSEEIWLWLQPVVECGDSAMTLTVRRRRAVQLLLDRVNESSVALSQLPPQCGYSVQTTWRDLSLLVQYDACHITLQSGSYELPLLWRGTPLRMSCPASPTQHQLPNPPSLCCSTHGLTIRVLGPAASEPLKVNVRGEWSPLVALADQCGFTLDRQDAQLIIAAPFIACGIRMKDGKYTLSLRTGEKTFTLSCPVSPTEDLPATRQPLTRRSEPFPWAPPFYLAPPDYPHPAYHHQHPGPQRPDANDPPTSTSSTFDPTFAPQPPPPVDPQKDYYSHHMDSSKHVGVSSYPSSAAALEDSGPLHPHLQKTSVLGLDMSHSSFPPPLQPRGRAYYHYYHHPKIPLPDPPGDPGPDFLPLSNPHKSGSSVLPPGFPRSVDLSTFSSDQLLQSEGADVPPHTRSPAQSFSYLHSSSTPHIVTGEAKRSASVKTDLSDYQVTLQPDSDQMIPSNIPSLIKPTLLSDEAKLEPPGPDAPEQPLVSPPSPDHDPFLYPYYPHPFFHVSQQHYDSANPVFPAPNKPQTTAPPSESADDGHHDFQQPHYYYQHLPREPGVTVNNQEVNPGSESFPVHSAEAGYPSIPQSSPYYPFYFADASQQHVYNPFRRPDREEAEDRMDDKVKGGVDTDLDTPSASPCGFGLVSDFTCVMASGCCSCPEEGCSLHLIFPVPELTAASSADPSEVFGPTTFHQSEVDGIESAPLEFPVSRFCVMDPPPPPLSATVQLRIATDESFTVFHPNAHLPLSTIKARPVYVEVRLLDPAEPELVLLVHSCLGHTQAPYISWMLVYDGCPSWGDTQLLLSPHPAHIQRILISSFLFLPSNRPTHGANGEYSQLEDPEIFFLCLAEVCSAAFDGCNIDCFNRPSYEE